MPPEALEFCRVVAQLMKRRASSLDPDHRETQRQATTPPHPESVVPDYGDGAAGAT